MRVFCLVFIAKFMFNSLQTPRLTWTISFICRVQCRLIVTSWCLQAAANDRRTTCCGSRQYILGNSVTFTAGHTVFRLLLLYRLTVVITHFIVLQTGVCNRAVLLIYILLIEKSRRRWEDNIKMDLEEVGRVCGDWMELAQDRDSWRALVSTVMNFWVS